MIQPAGIVLLLYVIYKRNSLDVAVAVAMCTSVFVTAGYFVSVGSVEVSYGRFFTLYSGIIFLFSGKSKIDVRLLSRLFVFLFFFCVSYLWVAVGLAESTLTYANGTDYSNGVLSHPAVTFDNVKELINVMVFSLFVLAFPHVNKEQLLNKIVAVGKVILVLLVVEFISKEIFRSNIFVKTVGIIFGKGIYQIDFLFERGEFYSLQGLTREPNHLCHGLLMWMLVVVLLRRRELPWLALCMLALLVSGSFAGSMFALVITFVFFAHNFRPEYLRSAVVLLLFFVGVASTVDFSYYLSRLSKFTLDLRVISVVHSYEVFLKNPLFGIGLGNSMSFSATMTLLSNLGVFGAVAWARLCMCGYSYTLKSYLLLFMLFLLYLFVGRKDTVYSASTLLIFLIMDKRFLYRGLQKFGAKRIDFVSSSLIQKSI